MMKKLFFIISLFFLMVSCLKEPEYKGFQLKIVVDFGADFPPAMRAGAKVSLFNQTKSYAQEAYTNEAGQVQFPEVEPGFYSVSVSHSYSDKSETHTMTGLKVLAIKSSVSDTIHLYNGTSGPFLIREFYYNGSTTPAGKPYSADQYIEIVNNSNQIQFADGISVLEHESYGIGPNMWEDIKDTIVVQMIWTIPGNGTEVPVAPGKSIVLARNGINHRSDPNGNPLSPVDLGNADFEFYVFKQPEKDLDSPGVSNLEEDLFVKRGNDVTFHVKGGSAIAIARVPGGSESDRKAYIARNLILKVSSSGSSSSYYAKIANQYVMDAVEVVLDEAHAVYKRFPSVLDAGYIYNLSGSGSGKCIRRKTSTYIGDRPVYQDTNNSSEDFLQDVNPEPQTY